MKCPHCQVEFHDEPIVKRISKDCQSDWGIVYQCCPQCQKLILELARGVIGNGTGRNMLHQANATFVYPRTASRPKTPPEVPDEFAQDYNEAALILTDSPKASAALSRRCLQHVLRQKAGVKHGNLANEIQEVLDSGKLPTHLAEDIDAIRNIGNFAAHPSKDTATGEIVDVEPGEAEWNLDVLDGLFDFYFVQPEVAKKRRDALNAKLTAIGKPAMK